MKLEQIFIKGSLLMSVGRISRWAWIVILLPLSIAYAEVKEDYHSATTPLHLGIEYYEPIEDDRNISTWNLNMYYPIGLIEDIDLSFDAVLTATYATGDITQLEGELSKGTLRDVNYKNSAIGIGPGILADLRLLEMGQLSFHLDAGISAILYNKNFPAGGDCYNFMERGGFLLKYDFENNQAVGIGYYRMHVSNGQGTGPQNPSYNAEGIRLTYTFRF